MVHGLTTVATEALRVLWPLLVALEELSNAALAGNARVERFGALDANFLG